MVSSKRYRLKFRRTYKRKFIILVLLFLVCSLWSFVNYTVVSDSFAIRCASNDERFSNSKRKASVELDVIKGNKQSSNASNLALMRKSISTTSMKSVNNFYATKISVNTEATTTKPTTKPPIDLVNDYYPFVDFKFVFPDISPKIDTAPNIFMIVLVNSGAKGSKFRKRREAIRETWGNQNNCEQRKALEDERLKDLRWLLVFVVGKAGPGTNDDELNMAEARQHNDMMIGNIRDNYINNVIKLYMGLVWANGFDIKYTLKTDDDVYVRIPRVLEYLVNAKFPREFYGGWSHKQTRVHRKVGDKWTISWKYFGEVNFPRFAAGAFYILSTDLFNRLLNYVYIRKPFHADDAYVGVAMRDFGVNVTIIFSFAVKPNMHRIILKANDCETLRLDAIGHNMDPESTRSLHNRFKTLACGSMRIKC